MKNFFHECEVINLKLQPVEISHKFYGTVITFNSKRGAPVQISQCRPTSGSPLPSVCVLWDTSVPESKVHGASMGPIWGRQDPGGPHVGPMNCVIWVIVTTTEYKMYYKDWDFIHMVWFGVLFSSA